MSHTAEIIAVGTELLLGNIANTNAQDLEEIDFKRHKDAVAYFNKTYIAKEIFPREMGKRLGRLKQERENSDYDDFYVASLKDASDQYKSAKLIIEKIEEYLSEKGIQY